MLKLLCNLIISETIIYVNKNKGIENMKKITCLSQTKRIRDLRKYYLENSPVSKNSSLGVGMCHRALLLYNVGWEKSKNAPTVKIRRACAEKYLLENMRPVIIRGELICGQPDYSEFSDREMVLYAEYYKKDAMKPQKKGRLDHMALDYKLLLDKGISGMLEMCEEKLSDIDINCREGVEAYEYYTCVKTELEGVKTLSKNYANEALKMAEAASGRDKKELLSLYEVLKNVPLKGAKTLREALQSIWLFTFSLFGIYSFGKPDIYLLPYYKNDIESGGLTPAQAQELIDSFFLLSVPNMASWAAEALMIGGRDENSKPVENELTWHFLRAIENTRLPDPNVGFCVTKETGADILDYVSSIIKTGCAQPSVWNYDEVVLSMIKNGYDKKDANMFTMSTCTEITPIGESGVSITSPYINLLKIFLKSLERANNDTAYEDIFKNFADEFASAAKDIMLAENLMQLERGRNFSDPVRISMLIHGCFEKGKSHDEGAAKYNIIEPNILGMQNVGESINVIRQIVFEKRLVCMEELKNILENNYKGSEELRYYIKNKTVHFGTGDERANNATKRVADIVLETFKPMRTVRGARMIPGAFSYRDHIEHGLKTSASPDGRLAGEPLNDGSGPVQGYDNQGPTMSLISTAAWEPSRFLGGTSVNIKLNESVSKESIADIIKGYIKLHTSQIQFNIVSTKTLKAAQLNPQKYKDLLIRIGGYSDFFVKIPKALQDEVISRSEQNL